MKVVRIGDPVLRQKAVRVEQFGEALKQTLDEMVVLMKKKSGVGLAAPQIGIPERFFVVQVPGEQPIAFVNPEIIETLQIVGRSQANYKKHKVADDSPIGKVVLGKRVNDQFIVEAPVGILTFTVLEITDGSEFEDENKDI